MSKKNVSAIVSGAGWISGFWHLMDKEMRRQGWTTEQIHALVTETEPEDQPIAKIVQALRAPASAAKQDESVAEPKKPVGLLVTYDQSIGLTALMEGAVGESNLGNISRDITQERFPLKGSGVRSVKCRVEPYLNGETPEQAYERLKGAVKGFGNTGDLAAFLRDHPDEVAKWYWVDTISEDSRWTRPDSDDVYVPCARVDGTRRYFRLGHFRDQPRSCRGVLVLCE